MKVHSITIGTAGHIDHGKSELVNALTGIHPDRLKEEKERGMTIDLGYSFYETSQGLTVGMIDVPGHERFIKNMVAGATSLHLVILAVAADDGVMPQTREHLDIMGVLGIRHGIVALTKIDLVDEEMAALAAEDIKDLLAGTFMEGAPIVPVSPITGEGMGRFREVLDAAIAAVEPVEPAGAFRMPVQRVFSAKGFGTVVTGVPVTGSVRVGDAVEVFPGRMRGRIRGIQANNRAQEEGRAGHRTAINISDVDYRSLDRGACVAAPDNFRDTTLFEAEIRVFEKAAIHLRNMSDVRVHAGTSEVMARIVLLDERALGPGDSGLVQLRLASPIVAVPGDRFILRLHSPMITIGGGTVVGLTSRKLKRFKEHIVKRVAAKRDSVADLKAQILIEVDSWPGLIVPQSDLADTLNASRAELDAALRELQERGDLVPVRAGQVMLRQRFERLSGAVADFLEEEHRRNPLAAYVDAKLLRKPTGLDPANLPGLLRLLEEKGAIETAKGGMIRRAGFAPRLTSSQETHVERLEQRVREGGATPLTSRELQAGSGVPVGEAGPALQFLIDAGRCVRVGEFIYHADVIAEFRAAIIAVAKEHGEVKLPILRDRFQTSRKWMIPLMEYFDGAGLTRRAGDKRYLRSEG